MATWKQNSQDNIKFNNNKIFNIMAKFDAKAVAAMKEVFVKAQYVKW